MKRLILFIPILMLPFISVLIAFAISGNELKTAKDIMKLKGIVVVDIEAKDLDKNITELRYSYKSRGYKIPSIAYLLNGKYLFLGPLYKFPSGEPLTSDLGSPEWLAEKVAFKKEGLPFRGKDGGIEIVEFLDMECPFCKKQDSVIEEVLSKYNAKIYVAPYPLSNHPGAMKKAAISMCAEEKKPGSFWKFKDLFLKENQPVPAGPSSLDECIPRMEKKIKTYVDQAKAIGVTGTPAFIIDGYLVQGYRDSEFFRSFFEAGAINPATFSKGGGCN